MQVMIATIKPRTLAAVRRKVWMGNVPGAFRPALDQVWAFLGRNPGLRTDGHNVFLYGHPAGNQPMEVDFGVEVTRRFADEGEVHCVETPSGEAAIAIHQGDYAGLQATHAAIHQWVAASGRRIGSHSMEIYGDWHTDPNKLETEIIYLLA
jgi:effector-binding domain-containing protein